MIQRGKDGQHQLLNNNMCDNCGNWNKGSCMMLPIMYYTPVIDLLQVAMWTMRNVHLTGRFCHIIVALIIVQCFTKCPNVQHEAPKDELWQFKQRVSPRHKIIHLIKWPSFIYISDTIFSTWNQGGGGGGKKKKKFTQLPKKHSSVRVYYQDLRNVYISKSTGCGTI